MHCIGAYGEPDATIQVSLGETEIWTCESELLSFNEN